MSAGNEMQLGKKLLGLYCRDRQQATLSCVSLLAASWTLKVSQRAGRKTRSVKMTGQCVVHSTAMPDTS